MESPHVTKRNPIDADDSDNSRVIIDTDANAVDGISEKMRTTTANGITASVNTVIAEAQSAEIAFEAIDKSMETTTITAENSRIEAPQEVSCEAELQEINRKNAKLIDKAAGLESNDESGYLQTDNEVNDFGAKPCEFPKSPDNSKLANNSLALIATAYSDSEEDTDDKIAGPPEECKIVQEIIVVNDDRHQNYREKESDSEDSEEDSSTSSDSSSDSSSSSSDSNSSSESSEETEKVENDSTRKTPRTKKTRAREKGEFDDLPPIEDLQITMPEVLCDPLGEVGWMVNQMVVVTAKSGKPTLNLDTVLFVEKGQRVLGRIFDVFGQVAEPHYCVRFNDAEHIKENNIEVGMTVYYCPNTPYTSLVFMSELLKMKASDDVGEDEHPEFSDDEEERAYYAALKQKQNSSVNSRESNAEVPRKRPKTGSTTGWRSQHPWNSNRRNQYPSATVRPPNQNYGHQQYQWRYPTDYSGWMTSSAYQNWPRPFYAPPHRPCYPQQFQATTNFAQQSGTNFSWQQDTQQNNFWSAPPPPPPPPPGV